MKTAWLTLALLAAAPLATAQDEAPATEAAPGEIPGIPPEGSPPPEAEVQPLAHTIGLGLRCPVCQGMPVAESTSNAAVQMQNRIRALVASGYTRDQIEDYFVDRYGEWVLLSPRASGLNQLVWIGPLLAFGLGLLAAGSLLGRREGEPATLDDAIAASPSDPYAERLLAEVDDDE